MRTFLLKGAFFSLHLAQTPSPGIITAFLTSAPWAGAGTRRRARVRAAKAGIKRTGA